MAQKVGVVLSGCGVFDGSEIHEAVSVLIALDQQGATAVCMAPNIPFEVTNHIGKTAANAKRNVMEESARIARGTIRDMANIKAADLDALIFPGGFGAAKNLCTFAADGPYCHVNPLVEKLILEMHAAGKPIGLACIAPVLAAKVLGGKGVKPVLTIGADPATAAAINAMNAVHQDVGPADICVDQANRLVTTPCYMNAVGPATVYQGAAKMVEQVLKMIR